jgi:N-acyl-D-amino-acid deacylase
MLLPWILTVPGLWGSPVTETEIRAALSKSIPLLQKSGKIWYEQQTCASCHHQALPMMLFGLARDRGVAVDKPLLEASIDKTFGAFTSLDRAVQNTYLIDPSLDTGYWLVGADGIGVPRSVTTSVYARLIARRQENDGGWITLDIRPPQSCSRVTATAIALRAMQAYAAPQMAAEVRTRVERAKAWLFKTEPPDTEDRAFQLFGLRWAGANSSEMRRYSDALLAEQRPDGGWRQIQGRESDSYATGEALAALHTAGGLSIDSPAYQRGLRFLLSSQLPDGSWLVKTRIPDQRSISPPYFETGFPHKEHQIISCVGTTWASMALLHALPKAAASAPALDFSRITPAGAEPWMEAALFGGARELQPLLEGGLDPNSKTAEGTTALMMASTDLDKVKLLIARGADVNARAKSGFTALTVAAAYHGTTDVVRTLLEKGAEVKNPRGVRVQFQAVPAIYAVSSGEVEKVELLAAKGAELRKPMLLLGFAQITPLGFAAQQGETAVVERLIRYGVPIEEQDRDGITALDWAAMGDRTETVKALIKLGANINHVDKYGMTPLHHAVRTYAGSTRTLEALLAAGPNLKVRTPQGETARELAARYGHSEFCAVLDRHGEKLAVR